MYFFFFFFSSRRRHTRFSRDWSSDVCSSDLLVDRQARTVRYLRVSLTDRCNYRCTYCMPEDGLEYGPRTDVLSLEEGVRGCRSEVQRVGEKGTSGSTKEPVIIDREGEDTNRT